MRALFGVVSLLIALAIVGLASVRQLRAVGHGVPSARASAAPDVPLVPQMSGSGTVREQSQQLQKQAADDVAKAMRDGAAAREREADKP